MSVFHYCYLELFSLICDLTFVPNSANFLRCFRECEELSIISITHNSFLCSEGTYLLRLTFLKTKVSAPDRLS